MGTSLRDLDMAPARPDDLQSFQAIRLAAFEPVFASFRELLGDEVYELAQKREDDAQGELLASLLLPDSEWEVYAARIGDTIVGFVSIQFDDVTRLGEIGLNAVHPQQAGKGIGTAMYEFAIARMKDKDMRVATVSTGADRSHAPARRAYEKAGFNAQVPSVWMCRKL